MINSKKMTHKLLILLCILSLFQSYTYAQSFLVKNKSSLKKHIRQAKSGDVIVMKNGIWSDVDILFKANGRKNAPITLRSQEQGKVIISGKSSLKILGKYLIVDGLIFKNGQPSRTNLIRFGTQKNRTHYSQLTNTKIINFNDKNESKRYDWVCLDGGTHNKIDHCIFTQMKNIGVTLNIRLSHKAPPNYHLIEHNEFSYRKQGSKNGYETIRVGESLFSLQNSRTTIKDNLFLKCNGELEIISNKSSENRYIHNTFIDSKGMLTLRHGNRCIVKDNIFLRKGNDLMGGVRIIGKGHLIEGNHFIGVGNAYHRAALTFVNGKPHAPLYDYAQVEDCNITNNTFIDTKNIFSFGANYKNGTYPLAPKNILIRGNSYY